MKVKTMFFIGFISMLFSLALIRAIVTTETDKILFRELAGTEENPEAASRFMFDMLRGKTDYIPPLARQKAIEHTKKFLKTNKFSKQKNISSWSALGPGNIGGRIRSLIIRPSNNDEMLVGAVAGGIWKTTNGGASWSPKNDDGNPISISCMANIGDTIFAGTGEGWGNYDATFGGGIWKSTDFGETWELLQSTLSNDGWDFKNVRSIRIAPDGTIFAVTFAYNRRDNGGNYYENGGLWKSTDYGNSWVKISASSMTNHYNGSDVMPITANTVLYATYSGWIYRTIDGGNNWELISNGLPRVSDYNRIAFAQDPNEPEIVYAVFATYLGDGLKGIYKTTNGGVSWQQLENPPRLSSTRMNSYLWSQGWYDNTIAINPFNSNQIYLGGVEMVRSFDGGNTWEQFVYGYPRYGEPVVHVDYHAIVFHPSKPGYIYVCNDGGIWRTTDGGDTWNTLNNNLEITQFYGGAVGYDDEEYQGGTQDNGHLKYTNGTSWIEVHGGDGGYAAVSQVNSKIAYEEYVYLRISKTTDGGNTWDYCINGLSDAGSDAECLFIAPFAMNPENSDVLIAGSNNVWVTTDAAENWLSSSSTLSSGEKISAVSIYNSSSPFLGFAGTTDGRIFKCNALAGENDNWVEITPPENNKAWVRRIIADRNDKSKIYAVYSGYNNDGVTPTKHVWYSGDQGVTWTDISGNLPDVPVHTILINPSDAKTLYIGTETGVYQTLTGGENWTKTGSGMPDFVPVHELVLQQGTNRIFAFTHGRGVFMSEAPLPVELATFSAFVNGNQVKLFWETSTEINSFGFDIERKSGFESTWEKIGHINAHGTVFSPQQYEFTDFPDIFGTLSYRLKHTDNDGSFQYSSIVTVKYQGTNNFVLKQNYPNSFNPTTTISYLIPNSSAIENYVGSGTKQSAVNVTLTVYNSVGQKVATLVNKEQLPGNYTVKFDASDLSSGVYFYTLRAGNFVATKKMILMK